VLVKGPTRNRKFSESMFIVWVLAGVFFFFQCREAKEPGGWKTYRDDQLRFEIKYPANLIKVSKDNQCLLLLHSIPCEHPNPCDFSDNPSPPFAELTDFKVNIEVFNRDINWAVRAHEGDYLTRNYLLEKELKLEPGFIDESRIGLLKGYRISSGTHGCGWNNYYFPRDSINTLFVHRSYVAELSPLIKIKGYEEYLKLPGVITPDKEEELFNRILATFKFLK